MTTAVRELRAAMRLDLGDVLRSRWLPFASAIYLMLAAALVLMATRESSVMMFTGMSRVMLSFTHVLLLVLPLLALTGTVQAVARAREDGTIELLFSHPLSRFGYLLSLTLTRFSLLLLPLVVAFLVMGLVARVTFGEAVPWPMIGRSLAVSACLGWAFTGVGVAVSAASPTQTRAVVWGLSLWALSVCLIDLALIGLLLRFQVDARTLFVLASLNPVQAARLALLSGLEPDLATLGPLGFYLTERVGAQVLLILGFVWPLFVGSFAWAWGWSIFRKGDLV